LDGDSLAFRTSNPEFRPLPSRHLLEIRDAIASMLSTVPEELRDIEAALSRDE
jgi:hypothetical protein